MARRPATLATRLALWYAGIFMLFFGAAFLLFYFLADTVLEHEIDDDLEEDIEEFRMLFKADGMQRLVTEIDREAGADDTADILLRVITPAGTVIHTSDPAHWKMPETAAAVLAALAASGDILIERVSPQGHEYPAGMATGRIAPGILLQIAETTEDKAEFMDLLLHVFSATFLLVMLFSGLVGWFMARRALRGTEEVAHAAADIAQGKLDRIVAAGDRGDEIEQLVSSFNHMAQRIRRLIAGIREVTDNIAHDLRSQVARIRANAETIISGHLTTDEYNTAAAEIIEECDRMMLMINTALDINEAEAGTAVRSEEDVDLTRLVLDACELFSPIAEDRNITLHIDVPGPCLFRGNIQQLQRILANLLDNALKYTPPSGRVAVTLERHPGHIAIGVADTGIGIRPEDLPRIFDRSFRCDQSRSESGFGLGLSLARAFARAHEGDITASSSPGEGSTFTLTLPDRNADAGQLTK